MKLFGVWLGGFICGIAASAFGILWLMGDREDRMVERGGDDVTMSWESGDGSWAFRGRLVEL